MITRSGVLCLLDVDQMTGCLLEWVCVQLSFCLSVSLCMHMCWDESFSSLFTSSNGGVNCFDFLCSCPLTCFFLMSTNLLFSFDVCV